MSFLNILLLGGAAAFLAPLAIHLLNRSRFQVVDWGAMHFLEAAMQVNARRPQWESWLLLLLRCLIPILFAMGLARPVLTQLRVSGAGGEQSLVVLLDNSVSMGVANGEMTALRRAVEATSGLAQRYRAAEFSVWSTGDQPRDVLNGTTFDPVRIERELAGLEANAGTEAAVAGLLAGIEQLGKMSNPSKQLVFMSDFQASQWSSLGDAQWSGIKQRLSAGPVPIQLSLLRLPPTAAADPTASTQNLAIRILPNDNWPVLPNESYRAEGLVTNHGSIAQDGVRVAFRVAQRDMASRTLSVPAGGTTQVSFACEFSSLGQHWIEMELINNEQLAADRLAADNRSQQLVSVIAPPKILLIDELAEPGAQASSDYLSMALTPFKSSAVGNPFQVEVARSDHLRPDKLQAYAAIVLADVTRLEDEAVAAVLDFVRIGGGLMIFAGPRLDADWYNAKLHDEHPLLPMQFSSRHMAQPAEPMKLANERIQVPWLTIFNSSAAGDLAAFEFSAWYELVAAESLARESLASKRIASPEQSAAPSSTAEPAAGRDELTRLLQFSNGMPWLVASRFGNGRVVQCATSCSEDGSNIPLQPVYLPLMQRLLAQLAVGSGDAIPSATTSPPAPDRPQSDGTLTTPIDPRESDLRLISDAELKLLAEQLGATAVDSVDQFVEQEQVRSQGQEVWRWLIAALLALLFGELLLGQKITRGSS